MQCVPLPLWATIRNKHFPPVERLLGRIYSQLPQWKQPLHSRTCEISPILHSQLRCSSLKLTASHSCSKMADHDLIVLRRHSFSQPVSPKPKVRDARPRRYSTITICHLPDRVVEIEPNLNNSHGPTVGPVVRHGRKPAVSTSIPSSTIETLPVQIPRKAPVPSRRHRSVIISNLPHNLNIRDILCRVRGGPVANCFLSTGPGLSGQEERYAIFTFENSKDAANYVAFLHDPAAKSVWTFPSHANGKDEDKVAKIHYHTDLAALGLRFDTDPTDLPLAPWAHEAIPGATRCLVVKACPLSMIERVFRDFRLLPLLLRAPNFRSQMEDIWLDNFVRDNVHGRSSFADLHIWFTNVNAAIAAMYSVRLTDRCGLSAKLRCEPDHCAREVATLVQPVEEGHPGHRWHSYGNISLLTLFDHGMLDRVFQDWRRVPTVHNISPKMSHPASSERANTTVRDKLNAVTFNHNACTISDLSQVASDMSSPVSPEVLSPIQQSLASTPHPEPTSPSVLYDAAFEAHKISPTSHDIATTFQIPVNAIDFLGESQAKEPPIEVVETTFRSADDTSGEDISHESSGSGSSSGSDVGMSKREHETGSTTPEQQQQQEQRLPNYTRADTHPSSQQNLVSWSCNIEEFMAMSDDQWMAFGTVFYVPPSGFDTAKRHINGMVFE